MKALIAFYSRAGENYFSGARRTIAVGNTEKAARLLAELTGAELFHIEQKVPYRTTMTPASPRRGAICARTPVRN